MATSSINKSLSAQSIKTSIYSQEESLIDFIDKWVPDEFKVENSLIAITSKIVSISENRFVAKSSIEKRELAKKEADHYLTEGPHNCSLTIKHGILIPSAGIDESNVSDQSYLLFPEDPFLSARNIWLELRKKWQVKNLGILLTDSHTTPLRLGVVGIALAHWGFEAVDDKRGEPDLFGREFAFTQVNTADALAATATWLMGETNNCCPICVLTGTDLSWTELCSSSDSQITPTEDLYYPLLKEFL